MNMVLSSNRPKNRNSEESATHGAVMPIVHQGYSTITITKGSSLTIDHHKVTLTFKVRRHLNGNDL